MDYLIQGDTLSEIADAIRGKTGSQAAIAVKNMASQIDSIQAGGGRKRQRGFGCTDCRGYYRDSGKQRNTNPALRF